MWVAPASGSGRSQASQSRPGKRCTVTSQAVPTPRGPVRSATAARGRAVSSSAAGSTLAASPSDSAGSPRNAMTVSEASGAMTSPAAAKSTTTDHRGALPKARRAATSRGRGRAAAALTGFAGCRRRVSPVETDLVDELARFRPRLGDIGERHRVGLQLAERAHEGVDRNAGSHRILVLHVGEDALGLVRGHELDELHGIVAVRRVLGDDGAGHVHMRAAVLERRQDDMDRLRPFLLLGGAVRHQADIVLVAEAISQTPAAMSFATSRSPPDGFLARLALTPRSHSSVLSSPCRTRKAATRPMLYWCWKERVQSLLFHFGSARSS